MQQRIDMIRTILAFLCGVGVTLAAVFFVGEPYSSGVALGPRVQQPTGSGGSAQEARDNGPALRSQSANTWEDVESRPISNSRARQSSESRAAMDSGDVQASRGGGIFANNAGRNSAAASRPADELDVEPAALGNASAFRRVPVAPEIAPLLDPDYAPASRRLHDELERQVRDPSWSVYMENQISAYLYGKQEILNNFSIPVVHCGTSICEVQAIGYGTGYSVWASATADAHVQPWFDFIGAGGPVRQSDGVTLIVWILQKDDSNQQEQSSTEESRRS